MKRRLALWVLVLVGGSLACVVGGLVSGLFYDGAGMTEAAFAFFGTLLSFAHATTLRLAWWVLAGAAFIAFRIHARATAI